MTDEKNVQANAATTNCSSSIAIVDEELEMANYMREMAVKQGRTKDAEWYRSGIFHLEVLRNRLKSSSND